jgi:multiple sugar transport system substrate-binding protein
MPSSAAQENVGSAGEDMFTVGKLAMFRCGYWPSKKLREAKGIDWDIAPFPRGPRARGHAWGTGGSGWAMCRGAKDKAKAFQVIKFLTSAENQTLYCAMGYSQPALMKLANSDVFLKQSPPATKKFLLQAPNVALYTPALSEWDEAQSAIVNPKIDLVMLGQKKAKPVMDEVTEAVNKKFFSK